MSARDEAVTFSVGGDRLMGVLSHPAQGAQTGVGVDVVVGGPQYRVGSHRQFALLARHLAGQGHAVLRSDARGMGDSEGEPPGFEASGPDIAAAMSALQDLCPTVRRVVLWGLCGAVG